MKKIGILTHSYGCNYGGTLQCLGLYKFLVENKLGEIKVLDYEYKGMYSNFSKYIAGSGLSKNLLKSIQKNKTSILKKIIIKYKNIDKILDKFSNFKNKNLKMSKKVTSKNLQEEIKQEKFDFIIVGSDQVWNCKNGIYGKKDFFLDGIENIEKIAYAVCSGEEKYLKADEERLKKCINDFKKVSVRNTHTKKLVEKITGKEPVIVCDPSILYEYKEFLNKEKPKEKYIFTYILGADIKEGNRKVIEEIKKIYGNIKVIAVGIPFAMSGGLNFYPWADEVIYNASPEEWLNYINNAEFVYTDSYHGALFSMKFHKPFLAYYSEKNRAPRFMDLAQRYNVDKYIVNTLEEAIEKKSICKEIDYTEIDKLIDEHRKYSMEFLKKALED